MRQGKQNINKTRQKQSLVNDGQHQLIHSWKIDIDAVIWNIILKSMRTTGGVKYFFKLCNENIDFIHYGLEIMYNDQFFLEIQEC